MRIYTKSGDKGETGLIGGSRVSKSSAHIEALGEIDELNAWLGLLRSIKGKEKIDAKNHVLIEQIQKNLYLISAEIADPDQKLKSPRISENDTKELENAIDEIVTHHPLPTKFLVPGGTPLQCNLHIARTVCRRAERRISQLNQMLKSNKKINMEILKYINRLSDYIFVLILKYEKFAPVKTKH